MRRELLGQVDIVALDGDRYLYREGQFKCGYVCDYRRDWSFHWNGVDCGTGQPYGYPDKRSTQSNLWFEANQQTLGGQR